MKRLHFAESCTVRNVLQISLYLTDDAIAKLYVTKWSKLSLHRAKHYATSVQFSNSVAGSFATLPTAVLQSEDHSF